MVALDTNVLVRFLVRDDEKQANLVRKRLIQAEAGKEQLQIPLLVLQETIWVLESAYHFERVEILESIEALTRMPIFQFENEDVVEIFLHHSRVSTYDLSDLLIAFSANHLGSDQVLTFDKKASEHPLFELMK